VGLSLNQKGPLGSAFGGNGGFWRRNAVEVDRQDARKAWPRISRYGVDADRVATLSNAA